jgi:hypothetical protein
MDRPLASIASDENVESRGGISPPRAPNTYVNLSIHTAPDVRPLP